MTTETIQEVLKRIEANTPKPAPRYCPHCENEVHPTDACWDVFSCALCKKMLLEPEVDTWEGETKGKAAA